MRGRALFVVAMAAFVACGEKKDAPGELVVAIQTDVALPDSVDKIAIDVEGGGAVILQREHEVGPGKLLIPATLGLLQGADPAKPVTFRLTASKAGKAKMIREVVTTIPSRVAVLRVPIRWLCDDSATTATCPAGQTCFGGECRTSDVDSNGLAGFVDGDVFGACFDVITCMSGGAVATPDPTACTIPKPPGPADHINVALRVVDDGVCDASKQNCFVVLDRTPFDGWQDAGDRILLPHAVCKRLADGRVKQIVTSTSCATKTERDPICGPWAGSGVGAPPPDGGGTTGFEVACTHPGKGDPIPNKPGICQCPQPLGDISGTFNGKYTCVEGGPACVDKDADETWELSLKGNQLTAGDSAGGFVLSGILCGNFFQWSGHDNGANPYTECGTLEFSDRDHYVKDSCYQYDTTGKSCDDRAWTMQCPGYSGRCTNTGARAPSPAPAITKNICQ